MGEEEYIKVSELNQKIYRHIGNNFINLKVKGEISNIYLSSYGHYYFDLIDESSKISCMLSKNYALRTIKPEEGVDVIIKGKVQVYKEKGTYKLHVIRIKKDGIGDLYLKYQKLKENLKEEGLFDIEYKKQIPKTSNRIGVITAESGAVIHDIITTTNRRWPFSEIILFPSKVQGEGAAEELVKQLKKADKYNLDTIIIGRGGGSAEELWCFNDEKLAREVFKAETPIISAVGHESDNTIIEEVADKRAPTPTAAAEFATPDVQEYLEKLESLKKRAKQIMEYKLSKCERDFNRICRSRVLTNPQLIYKEKQDKYNHLMSKLKYSSNQIFSNKKSEFDNIKQSFKYQSSKLENYKRNLLNNTASKLEYNSNDLIKNKRLNLDQTIRTLEYGSNDLIKNKRLNLDQTIRTLEYGSNDLIRNKRLKLDQTIKSFEYNSSSLIKSYESQLENIKNTHILKNPEKIVQDKRKELNLINEKISLLDPRKMQTIETGLTKQTKAIIYLMITIIIILIIIIFTNMIL